MYVGGPLVELDLGDRHFGTGSLPGFVLLAHVRLHQVVKLVVEQV